MSVKLNIVSDLHSPQDIDYNKFNYDADYIVVAGDCGISVDRLTAEKLKRKSKSIVIYTLGNHDIFDIETLAAIKGQNKKKNTIDAYDKNTDQFYNYMSHCGNNTIISAKFKLLFICCPLLSLVEDISNPECQKLDDYLNYTNLYKSTSKEFDILNFNLTWDKKFILDYNFIIDSLNYTKDFYEKEGYRVILVTHGIPSYELISNSVALKTVPKLNCYWASDKNLFKEITENCSLWIHGHSHEFCDMTIGNTRYIRNPLRDYNMNIIDNAYGYTIEF